MKQRRQERRKEIQAYNKRYKQTESGKIANRVAAHNHNRKRALAGRLDPKTVQQVYEENIKKYGTLTCELCFKPVIFGQDAIEHDVPISRRDEFPNVRIHARENLSVAHGVGSIQNCNSCKGTMTKKEWFGRHPEYKLK
jgi:ribosomal protein L35